MTTNDILQDLHYWYDPIGNITEIQDDAQQTLFYNNSVVAPTQKFIYDALYRLIEASGRELIGTAILGAKDNWNDNSWQTTHKGDGNAVQNYTQHYTYDEVGNILELQHVATTGSYTRTYDIDTGSNRLLSTEVGMTTYEYDYDARGNMVEMPHLSSMVWNIDNELSSIVKGSEPTHYQYSNGQRVRKYTDKGSIKEERIYLGNYEIYRKFDNTSSLILERTTVHISDDTGRIAMLEERTIGTDPSPATLQRYIYSNHLQSASLELEEFGEVISYEEYHPYGTTAYQANNASINAVAKRYRYTGKERDEESGLYYHGARYYIPWLCRWCASDPLEAKYAGLSPYNYSFNNPIVWNDLSGMQPGDEDSPKGVWYYDKNDVLKYDKEHSYSNFPKSKGTVRGTDFWRLSGGQPGDKEGGSYHHKADGTAVYYPPIKAEEFDEINEKGLDRYGHPGGWVDLGNNKYEYYTHKEYREKGIKNKMVSEVHDGITGKHYRADGTVVKVKVYESVSIPSTPQPKPTVTDTPVAPPPPKPPVNEQPKPTPQPVKQADRINLDKANTVVGATMTANTTKEVLIDYAKSTGDIGKTGSKYLKFIKGTGVVGSLYGIGVSGYNIYNDYNKSGRGIADVNAWDVADATIGTGGLVVSGLVTVGLVSNPVGWGVAIGIGAYFLGRLIYQAATSN